MSEFPVNEEIAINRPVPAVPQNVTVTVECFEEVTSPELPVVDDLCGNILDLQGPVITGTYEDCEGTYVYTYTYTGAF